jgi:hypothetical protein
VKGITLRIQKGEFGDLFGLQIDAVGHHRWAETGARIPPRVIIPMGVILTLS